MNLRVRRNAIHTVAFAALSFLLGCSSQRSCDEAEEAIIDIFFECQLDGLFDSGSCTDGDRQLYECYLTCYEGVPCDVLQGKKVDEYYKVYACFEYCDYLSIALEEQGMYE